MAATAPQVTSDLRRAVTIWGSYSWGYADVGADIYVALGLVMGAAMGAANVAFAFAGIVYVCIGMAYTELAAAYPVAGGGQFFVTRALGDIVGFIAGWAVLLDFTIDIAIFAWATIGYLSSPALVPWLGRPENIGWYFAAVIIVTAFLVVLNVLGVRHSSRLNEIITAVDTVNELIILAAAFMLAWKPQILFATMQQHWPTTENLLLGISLAIISFVGLESISQAAEETHRPSAVLPRTSIALILTILIYALGYSNLVLGMGPAHDARGNLVLDERTHQAIPMYAYLGNVDNNDKAVAVVAGTIPVIGPAMAFIVPLIGAFLVLISSNSGVFGASRIAYSMGKHQLLPSWFQRTDRRTRTPVQTILVFSGVAFVELFLAFLQGKKGFDFLADLYAFGAALSYTLVFVALITLRFTDSVAPRKFRMPLNIPMTIAGKKGDLPVSAVVGLLGIASILAFTLLTHPTGRIAGPTWVICGITFFVIYRLLTKRPIFSSVDHNWVRMHKDTLVAAGELEMLDEYTAALAAQKPL